MSTKIYFAYRCGIKDFTNTLLPIIRNFCFKRAAKVAKEMMGEVEDSVLIETYARQKEALSEDISYETFLKQRGRTVRLQHVFDMCREASNKLERDLYCIDVSLNIWLYNNKAYIVPIGEHWLHDGFKIPECAEDYAYWNNVDRPDEVTAQQWRAREKMWEKVCLNDHNSNRLNHEIINAKKSIGLYEVARCILSDKQAQIASF